MTGPRIAPPGSPVRRAAPTAVDFHFDLMCPWAYQTSRWMREVRDHAGVSVNWRFFSLEEVNREEGKNPWERRLVVRVVDDAYRRLPAASGHGLLDRWYATAGEALHVTAESRIGGGGRGLLGELGLDPAGHRRPWTTRPRRRRCGPSTSGCPALGAFGVPTLVFMGDRACSSRARTPGGRGRRARCTRTGVLRLPSPLRGAAAQEPCRLDAIARAFAPYLEARDWESVQKETP